MQFRGQEGNKASLAVQRSVLVARAEQSLPAPAPPGRGMAKTSPAGLPKGLDGQDGSRGMGSNGLSSP